MTKRLPRVPDSESNWVKVHIALLSAERKAVADADFSPPLPKSAQVWDDRYQIGYELGGDIINVDGRLFQTDEPLQGDVGTRLEYWMAKGRFIDATGVPVIEDAHSDKSPTLSLWDMAAGVSVLAGLLLIVLSRRRWTTQ